MAQSLSVLLLDDGELDDVQELLESMQVPFGRIRGASIVPGMEGPTDLLIATPRRIEAIAEVQDRHPEGSAPVRIVVTREDSNAMREQLRRTGFDYIVRRPVHPEALRLLILHAMYSGEERRMEPRVSIGFDISFKAGIFPHRGTLADLSSRGCRLLTSHRMELGKRLRIQIPEALGASEPFQLRGRVLRANFDPRIGSNGLYSVAVLFEKVANSARQELEWIIEERSQGPPRLNEAEERGEEAEDEVEQRGIQEIPAANLGSDPRFETEELDMPELDLDARSKADDEDEKPLEALATGVPARDVGREQQAPSEDEGGLVNRRRIRRAAFEAKVPAFGSRALRVLVGRDLSVEGMRVETSPDLTVGDRLHLAIYGDPEEEPFLLWATVDRDDGERGVAISFDELHPLVANKLEKLVTSLPAVESLNDEEAEAMGTVISEMLPPENR
jgi:CheY-like chemotaxis protein